MIDRELLENEIKRAEEMLPQTDVRTKYYGMVLGHLGQLEYLLARCGGAAPEPVPAEDPEEKAPWVEQTPYSAEEPEEPEEPEEKEISFVKNDWTREEVRAVLDEAKNRGTILRPIIEKFVPAGAPVKFSSIPASRYKELVEELNNA